MYRLFLFLALFALVPAAAAQSTYFVATDGNDFGSGSIDSPLATVERALSYAVPGDTIYIRGGTYASPEPIQIQEGGEEGAYLHIWAYADEEPVLDFTGANRGFDLRGDYIHMKGITVERSGDNGIYLDGASYNIIEQMVSRDNGDSGVQVQDGSAHNLILNTDSYDNYDPGNNGENADGFAIKFGVGPGNVLRGCRAWGNSDDGYDFWSQDDPEQQGIRVEDSWAFENGINVWDDPNFRGDSNGFKLGHGPGAHVLVRNVAWGHLAHGFDINGNLSGVTLYNNTGYLNGNTNFYFDDDQNVEQGVSVLRNNLSFGDIRMDATVVDAEFNTWNSEVPNPQLADFLSTDPTGAGGPRQPDGSLPALDFLHLAEGSDLIDAGTDVGLPFVGAAPDLGAYESPFAVPTEDSATPRAFALHAAYPNPFRAATQLAFEMAEAGPVRLVIYDALGRTVATLVDDHLVAGSHTVRWGAARLAAGLYIARLEADGNSDVVSLTHLK